MPEKMYSTAYANQPLPGYSMPFDHMRTPPVSPQPGTHGYYSPRYSVHTATPSPRGSPKMHARGYSQQDPPLYTYASPRTAGQYSSAYSSPRYFSSQNTTPQRNTPDYVPIYTEADSTPHRSRARRASHSSPKPQQPQQQPRETQTPKRPSTAKATPKATEADARRCNIPAGYSLKNWDPTEEPILLLGSVFDANSLGKWIYDWTVFHFGAGEPMTDVAGELWLLLIQLSGKVKRAEECMPKIRKQESREMVDDFLESGERLWLRVGKLLKLCEEYMWRAARRECGDKKPVTMGKNAGREFVSSIFGRDRELEKTEKLMTGIRLWSMRFDANCEEILRFPSA